MTTGIRSNDSGTFGALTFGGGDAVTFDATGIKAGSYKAGSIDSAALEDGALIENAPEGIGYGPGAGGTVRQYINKAKAVTLNKPCGQITMNAATLAAGDVVGFVLNNSLLNGSDSIMPSIVADGVVNPAQYNVWAAVLGIGGNASIYLKNMSTMSRADEVVIDFKIIKGATY